MKSSQNETPSNWHYIAVYGSLKRGFWNHSLLEDSKLVREASTEPQYRLFSSGIPYLIDAPNDGYPIHLEIYKVTDLTLARLDRLEGHGRGFYERRLIQLAGNENKWFTKPVEAYFYCGNIDGMREITNGDWQG